jgi:hypothetical protein
MIECERCEQCRVVAEAYDHTLAQWQLDQIHSLFEHDGPTS